MNTMTLEQVRDWLKAQVKYADDETEIDLYKPMFEVLDAHLREREAAKGRVTDEVVKRVAQAAWDACQADVSCKGNVVDAVRAALGAVAPMLASAGVTDAYGALIKQCLYLRDIYKDHRFGPDSFEANFDAMTDMAEMLAAAPRRGEKPVCAVCNGPNTFDSESGVCADCQEVFEAPKRGEG